MGSGSKPMIYTSEFSRPAIWTHSVYPYFYTPSIPIFHILHGYRPQFAASALIRIARHFFFLKRLRCCDGLLQPTLLDWHHGIQTPLQAPVSSDRVHSGPSVHFKRVLTCFNTNTAIVWWLKLLVDPLQAHSFLNVPKCLENSVAQGRSTAYIVILSKSQTGVLPPCLWILYAKMILLWEVCESKEM